ncbi:hypothetical protein HPULCUR_000656 [Helicostylum pulchrum]|uniref:Uncharacterized protein n=1 Tax=Helicostylum pulchrum TaxID=562976 RepID=A0ABP9XKH9_9FUNG
MIKFLKDYRNAHMLLYSHMSAIADKYGDIDKKLRTIKQNLASLKGVKERNHFVLSKIKGDANGIMEIFTRHTKKIEEAKVEIVGCREKTKSEIQGIKKDDPLEILQAVCESVGKGYPLALLGMELAKDMVTSEIMVRYIGLAGNPVYALCFVSLYTTVSQLYKYFKRKRKRKQLAEDLHGILIRLERLFKEVDGFNESHTDTFKELEYYLASIDTAIDNLNGEGAINVEESTNSMLEETKHIQGCFVALKDQAKSNANALREPLRGLDLAI